MLLRSVSFMNFWKLLSLGGVGIAGTIAFLSTTRVSGEDLTRGNFSALEVLIRQFEREWGRLPGSLNELGVDASPVGGRLPLLEDVWGGRILYAHDGTHVRLSSLGSDRKIGGGGSARDLEHTFLVARRHQR
jgi:hypothetical protein